MHAMHPALFYPSNKWHMHKKSDSSNQKRKQTELKGTPFVFRIAETPNAQRMNNIAKHLEHINDPADDNTYYGGKRANRKKP
jgi:hypothetical protein